MVTLTAFEAYTVGPLTDYAPGRQDPVQTHSVTETTTLGVDGARELAEISEALLNINNFLTGDHTEEEIQAFLEETILAIYGDAIDIENQQQWGTKQGYQGVLGWLQEQGEDWLSQLKNFGTGLGNRLLNDPIQLLSDEAEKQILDDLSSQFGIPTDNGFDSQTKDTVEQRWATYLFLLFAKNEEAADATETAADGESNHPFKGKFDNVTAKNSLLIIQASLLSQFNERLGETRDALDELTELTSDQTLENPEDLATMLGNIEAAKAIAESTASQLEITDNQQPTQSTDFKYEGDDPDLSDMSYIMANYQVAMAALLGNQGPKSAATDTGSEDSSAEDSSADAGEAVSAVDTSTTETEAEVAEESDQLTTDTELGGTISNIAALRHLSVTRSEPLGEEDELGQETKHLATKSPTGKYTLDEGAIERLVGNSFYHGANPTSKEAREKDLNRELVEPFANAYNSARARAIQEWNTFWTSEERAPKKNQGRQGEALSQEEKSGEATEVTEPREPFYTVESIPFVIGDASKQDTRTENGTPIQRWEDAFGESSVPQSEEQAGTEPPTEEDKLFQLSLTNIEAYIRLLQEREAEQDVGNIIGVVGTEPVTQAALPTLEAPTASTPPTSPATATTPAATLVAIQQQLTRVPTAPVPAPVPQT